MADILKVIISGDAKSLISALKQAGTSVDSFGDNAGKATSSTSGGWSSMLGVVGKAAPWIAIGTAVLGVASNLSTLLQESGKMAAASERLEGATTNLGKKYGLTSDTIVKSIQQASGYTISRFDAMQSANAALLFGVAKTGPEFQELTSIAVTLGRAMGQDATKSLNDLTLAISRQSPMILDNLGISLKLSDAYEAYAARLGKTASELTETEKKQAFLNAALAEGRKRVEELGGVHNDSAANAERATAAWDDFRVALGEASGVSVIQNNLLQFKNRTLRELTDWLSGPTVEAQEIFTAAVVEEGEAHQITAEEIKAQEKAQQDLMNSQIKYISGIQDLQKNQEEIQKSYREAIREADKTGAEERLNVERDFNSEREKIEQQYLATVQQADAMRLQGHADVAMQIEATAKATMDAQIAEVQREKDEELRIVGEKEEELKAKAEAKRAEEMAKHQEHMQQLVLETVLAQAEANGTLEQMTGLAGVSAKQAAELYKAGVIQISEEVITAAGKMGETMSTDFNRSTSISKQNFSDLGTAIAGDIDKVKETIDRIPTAMEIASKQGGASIKTELATGAREANATITQEMAKANQQISRTRSAMGGIVLTPGLEQAINTQLNQMQGIGNTAAIRRQHGGPVFPGNPYIVGEAGPEMFMPQSAGQIIPNNTINNNNNFNMTLNSQAQTEQVMQSFAMMQALMGG